MAHHKDALKKIKQSEKRRLRNKAIRTRYRAELKRVREAIAAKDAAAADKALQDAVRALDSAVTKNVLHRKFASRHKSRLSRAVNQLKSSSQAA